MAHPPIHHQTDLSSSQVNTQKPSTRRIAFELVFAVTLVALGLSWLGPIVALIGLVCSAAFAWKYRHIFKRGNPRRYLKFTRDGKYMVAITVGVGLAAINTGNNLLYLFLGMLLSMIVVSGILSEITLRRLEVRRKLPSFGVANTPFLVSVRLVNNKAKIPSFSVQIDDKISPTGQSKTCFFLKVRAGTQQETNYRIKLPKRGLYGFAVLTISTRFPFGFFAKRRIREQYEPLTIVPEIRPVASAHLPLISGDGTSHRSLSGLGREFANLRAYRTGDDARDIHWKRSAARKDWVTREYETESTKTVNLVLHPWAPDLGPHDGLNNEDAADVCVSLVASLSSHYVGSGYCVNVSIGQRRFQLEPSRPHLNSLLLTLALFQFEVSSQADHFNVPIGGPLTLFVVHPALKDRFIESPTARLVGPEVML